jgi:hypothetical protein
MKNILALMVMGLWMAASGAVWADGKQVTQKYEIVCMKCIAKHAALGDNGGKGAGHAACATKCAMGGTDLGLMDTKGNLYQVVDSDFKPARAIIVDKAGQTVELTGEIVKTKGVNYLKLATPSVDKGMDKDKN